MKLIASLIVHNELERYLIPCIEHLTAFCDEIRVFDDGSTDGTQTYLDHLPNVECLSAFRRSFFEHEGRARQKLLDWTFEGDPTHVLAIDADEFVADGPLLRSLLEQPNPSGVWGLNMQEVWGADEYGLVIRQDGGWREHALGIVYSVPPDRTSNRVQRRAWRMVDRALACGRTPTAITIAANRSRQGVPAGDILHFGWACQRDRDLRYQRYVTHDSGKFHANSHIESIMWPDDRVELTSRAWPRGIDRAAILEHCDDPEPE